MNREEAEKFLPVIQAFAEGKTIETYSYSDMNWVEANNPSFSLCFEYRVKPESKYRPFENEEECFFEMKKHEPFGWIAIDETYKSIASLQEKYLYLNGENSLRHYFTLFRDATFADGTPFGIKEGGEE